MAWIESHQSLSRHRKTIKATKMLGVTRHTVIGHLHELWWWALDNATLEGDLKGITRGELAEAAGWFDKKRDLVQALLEAGFLEETNEGFRLHDWWSYAGKLNAKRAKDRERKSPGVPADFQRSSNGSRTEVAGTVPTVPTQHTQPTEPTAADAASADAAPPAPTPIKVPRTTFKNSAFEVTEELIEWATSGKGLIPPMLREQLHNATEEWIEFWEGRTELRTVEGWTRSWKDRMRDRQERRFGKAS